MRRPRRNGPVFYALCGNAALLLAILIAVAGKGNSGFLVSPAMASSQTPPIAGGAGLFLMPAQFSTSTWGCYIMDVDSQTLCAYQFYPGEKQLRLVAARDFHFDRKLGRFNTVPNPLEVKKMTELEQDVRGAEAQPPQDTTPNP